MLKHKQTNRQTKTNKSEIPWVQLVQLQRQLFHLPLVQQEQERVEREELPWIQGWCRDGCIAWDKSFHKWCTQANKASLLLARFCIFNNEFCMIRVKSLFGMCYMLLGYNPGLITVHLGWSRITITLNKLKFQFTSNWFPKRRH